MIKISVAEPKDYLTIQQIAHQTWYATFGKILSEEQIDYMLGMMYSLKAIEEQIEQKGHIFLLAKDEESYLGYASYETSYQERETTKIHKIYVLPTAQGKGVGKILMDSIEKIAKEKGNKTLSLNVNRYNPAINFYEKIGFKILKEEDIDIGKGFLMQDFIMEKNI
ncbi:GNAT family N-acetyltransferase [Thermoflexibacter ruber]|uniref:Ribosomal protein S18 acetylase RimI n=1 Tax=Thermoflexibacter ruber TaxID=1003 RepID=A0A1I2C183_9BACT|nr:GNAT family N-acetyltransferase [Thermoflexibacter ruber]SFE61330.1 Ribosomal protein S18 acetylase RimI [Thermoflexibacter ruber]